MPKRTMLPLLNHGTLNVEDHILQRIEGSLAMLRFHCPKCGLEKEVATRYGDEVVSVYCLEHAGGVDAHTRPVYMAVVPIALAAPQPELALA